MAKKSPEILVGDLLVKSGVISRSDLADALPISLKTGLPVGRILISSGTLKEPTLQAALFAQSLVRDCLLSEDFAVQALKLLHADELSLDDALAKLGWKSEAYELTNRLGQLFLDTEIISEDELELGLEGFYAAGLPLARVLVVQGVIDNNIAFAALTAQRLIRDQLITREQAIEALKSAAANGTSIEESLHIHGYLKLHLTNTIRLGELLVLAGLATEEELLENVERSLSYEEFIGETFVHAGRITQSLLEAALELQRLATENTLEPRQAAEALRRIAITGMSVDEAVFEVTATGDVRAKLLGLQTEEAHVKTPKKNSHPSSKKKGKQQAEQAIPTQKAMADAKAEPTVTSQSNEQDAKIEKSTDTYEVVETNSAQDFTEESSEVSAEYAAEQASIAPYMMALRLAAKGKVRKRKKISRATESSKEQRKNTTESVQVDSALLALAELQCSLPRDSTSLSRQHLKLISKLMHRIEALSYRAGYLEGCIDTANDEDFPEVVDQFCHSVQATQLPPQKNGKPSLNSDKGLYRKRMIISAQINGK